MTLEEEIPLVLAAKDGNVKATEKLIKQYIDMIRHYCRRYKNLNCLEPEDLHQECILIFYQALNKYDPNSNVKFGTYLFTQLQMVYRFVIYNDFVIRRPANYMTILKEDESQCISAVSIDEKIPGNNHGDTFADLHIDLSDTPDTALIKDESHNHLVNVLCEVFGKYTEEEILHLMYHYDLYEIMGYPVLDDYPLPKSHRDRIHKSFMKNMRSLLSKSVR